MSKKSISEYLLGENHSSYSRLIIEFFVMLSAALILNPFLDPEITHKENLEFCLLMASAVAFGNFIYLKVKAKIAR